MNEEMLTYEEMDVENTEVNEETHVEPKTSGNGVVGAIVGGTLVAGVVGIGTLLWNKTKDKREARKIEKLRKKGYVIIEPDVADAEEIEGDSENDDEIK